MHSKQTSKRVWVMLGLILTLRIDIEKNLDGIRCQLKSIALQNSNTCAELERIIIAVEARIGNYELRVINVEKTMVKDIAEAAERNKRENNVIAFHVPELDTQNGLEKLRG